MKFRIPLCVLAALLIASAAFAQYSAVNDNTKLYQPDNNQVKAPGIASAVGNPSAGSSFQVIYANRFDQSFESINVMNTGTAGGVDGGGTICVNVYVFDTAQNFQDCCYCKVSPNGLGNIMLSYKFAPASLVIKLLATYPSDPTTHQEFQPNGSSTSNNAQPTGTTTNACNPADPATGIDPTLADAVHTQGIAQGTSYTPTSPVYSNGQQYLAPGMAAWIDITQYSTNFNQRQLEFHQSTLSKGEASNLALQCANKHGGILGRTNVLTSQCASSVCN